jgi:2-polyprenyl-3-methyl-5-hydroxy-6-metoxy-1,4-benzoquinol methylase
MSKQEEIHYISNMERVLGLNREVVRNALKSKPWNERSASRYFLDFGEILGLLTSPPARILDLGVGPGWTSIFLARCGYSVLGLDIAPDMVQTASENAPPELAVQFLSHDY